MAWLAADWETRWAAAAREKLRSRTTSQKSRRASRVTARGYIISDSYVLNFQFPIG
jgi:hypothetical protein